MILGMVPKGCGTTFKANNNKKSADRIYEYAKL